MNKLVVISALSLLVAVTTSPTDTHAQGSIFGPVTNSDLSVPADSELVFFGFLDQTDNEIRISSSDGAGYQNGNWFDDFQNFLGEAPGMPYDYFFFNPSRGESFNLSKLVPVNSFQEEAVQLAAAAFPLAPGNVTAVLTDSTHITLRWLMVPGNSYHIYRRSALSNGSFFRVDNPAGILGSAVEDSIFVDSGVTPGQQYVYLVISRDSNGIFSPPSPIIHVSPAGCCVGLTGNIDGDPDDIVDINDITRLISYLFMSGPPPVCMEEGNIDGDPDGVIDIGDVSRLIDYLFVSFAPPAPCR